MARTARFQLRVGLALVNVTCDGSRVIGVDRERPLRPNRQFDNAVVISTAFIRRMQGALAAVSSRTRPDDESIPWLHPDEARVLIAALRNGTCEVIEQRRLRLITHRGSFIFAGEHVGAGLVFVTATPLNFAAWAQAAREANAQTRLKSLERFRSPERGKRRDDSWATSGMAQMKRFLKQQLIRKQQPLADLRIRPGAPRASPLRSRRLRTRRPPLQPPPPSRNRRVPRKKTLPAPPLPRPPPPSKVARDSVHPAGSAPAACPARFSTYADAVKSSTSSRS